MYPHRSLTAQTRMIFMDTLELANDYVNLEWDEFKEKHERRAAS